ncbi:hypothetical protein CEXT_621851 [Caerostris extrusa]|uniref:Uncharacterized protein n=1 Tax=Caerostris extrusa TaxID=172846 RepID=A0AAV4N8N8_CAEEX|nr:hypothetical protein CEXT_621851 [Caerostris extrusa]
MEKKNNNNHVFYERLVSNLIVAASGAVAIRCNELESSCHKFINRDNQKGLRHVPGMLLTEKKNNAEGTQSYWVGLVHQLKGVHRQRRLVVKDLQTKSIYLLRT